MTFRARFRFVTICGVIIICTKRWFDDAPDLEPTFGRLVER